MIRFRYLTITLLLCTAGVPISADSAVRSDQIASSAVSGPVSGPVSGQSQQSPQSDEVVPEVPWDYSPYRVLIWLASDNPNVDFESVERSLRCYLDRDFAAVWRTDVAPMPTAIRTIAARGMGELDYDSITANDPVVAVKRDHPDAVRIRIPANVAEFCKKVLSTQNRIDSVIDRATDMGDATISGIANRLTVVDGDEATVCKRWSQSETEALLVSRGMAKSLVDPEAKLVSPRVSGLVSEAFDSYDKIFIVQICGRQVPGLVEAVEIDTLMQHFGPVVAIPFSTTSLMPAVVGHCVTKAFAPVVRIEEAGQRNATGLLRAGGLIQSESSPAWVGVDDALEPMIRKNDRNGQAIAIGPVDWALLLTTAKEGRYLKMDFYAGRTGTLQGRKNKRTFRIALKARPQHDSTLLRLHLQRKPNFPLIGYELYEKEFDSKKMIFVGRTDWDGRLRIEKSEFPVRLLYVKNGGSVLARLPVIPGLYPKAIADLSGDDMRLQAEAYVRGAQNEITDLVAMRELYKARIRKRLEQGEMDQAEELMSALRKQPTSDQLSAAIGQKQIDFLEAIGKTNIGQRRKVDEMFNTTRELLSKYITPQLVRELEADMIAARANGGRLPAAGGESDAATPAAAKPTAATQNAAAPDADNRLQQESTAESAANQATDS